MDSERELRVYSEIMTGDWAWETQVRFFITLNMNPLMCSQANLPDHGRTLLPVLLGSDKTHLTVFAGDKKAWPLYLSLGNIKSSFCNKPRNHAWVLGAYLPVVTFEAPKPGFSVRALENSAQTEVESRGLVPQNHDEPRLVQR
jgi:hypothetical protein